MKIKIGKIYQHTEGLLYKVIKFVLDATDYEKTRTVKKMVLYQQLKSGKYPAGTQWVREEKDFLEHFKQS